MPTVRASTQNFLFSGGTSARLKGSGRHKCATEGGFGARLRRKGAMLGVGIPGGYSRVAATRVIIQS